MSDPDANDATRCPQCGAEFVPASSPLGLCPSCLLKLGASDPAFAPLESPGASAGKPNSLGAEAWSGVGHAKVARAPEPANSRGRSRLVWTAIAVMFVAVIAALRVVPRSRSDNTLLLTKTVRFSVPLPDGTEPIEGAQFAVSPDGTSVVLAARSPDGRQHLWLRALQSMQWRELARTEGAAFPFWSPDSRHVGFFAEKKLKRIDISNGLTQTLCDASSGRGATWGNQGAIVFAPRAGGPLFRVSASGGTPQPVTTLDRARGEAAHSWPHFLPDGNSALFVVSAAGRSGNESAAGLYVVSLDSGRRRLLVPNGGMAAFAQGHLLFVRGSELLAQRFDPNRAELRDDVQPISGAERVGDPSSGGAGFSVSGNGVLIHDVGAPRQSQLTWFDRSGRILDVSEPDNYQHFSLSPDGSRVAIARRQSEDNSSSIWLIDSYRHVTTRVTTGPSRDESPLWSPDGVRIVFASSREGLSDLYVLNPNDLKEQILHQSSESKSPTDWSPDGRVLVYSTESSTTGSDLWTLPLDGDRKPQALLQSPFNESDGRFSPDGRQIAYVSDESGRDEVYVRTFPQIEGRWQISTGGGSRPRWRRDGRELFFRSSDGQLMAIEVQTGSPIRTGTPRVLFALRQADSYEVSPDSQRFLVKMPVREQAREIQVVLNWTSELRR